VPSRAGIVTGGSRGIGLVIASALADEGYALTLLGRQPEPLGQSVSLLRQRGFDIAAHAANLNDERAIRAMVAEHRERFGRVDVLVNGAGLGVGAAAGEQHTKYLDMQLDINLRAIVLLYRECADMVHRAGGEHRRALVVNLASIAGKTPRPMLSVYSSTKAAVINYTQAMNLELNADGIRSVALCPDLVATDMTAFAQHDGMRQEDMIQTQDIAEAVRFILRLSPSCVIPEIEFRLAHGDAGTHRYT
jgi:NAD(P)-dependent dehydrogenase (short-subunit alcohol dehydrogenase family)